MAADNRGRDRAGRRATGSVCDDAGTSGPPARINADTCWASRFFDPGPVNPSSAAHPPTAGSGCLRFCHVPRVQMPQQYRPRWKFTANQQRAQGPSQPACPPAGWQQLWPGPRWLVQFDPSSTAGCGCRSCRGVRTGAEDGSKWAPSLVTQREATAAAGGVPSHRPSGRPHLHHLTAGPLS
jgi:hypothetical protein